MHTLNLLPNANQGFFFVPAVTIFCLVSGSLYLYTEHLVHGIFRWIPGLGNLGNDGQAAARVERAFSVDVVGDRAEGSVQGTGEAVEQQAI